VALMNPTRQEEDDGWFGDGSAFDSGEELAAALLELAGTPTEARALVAEQPASLFEERMGGDLMFELLRPETGRRGGSVETTARARSWGAVNTPLTWTVRKPGSIELPQRKPGKTGWSIRSSVAMLQRTEEVLLSLREEAVGATLVAASRAVRTGKRK
jgi:hypothetical protein